MMILFDELAREDITASPLSTSSSSSSSLHEEDKVAEDEYFKAMFSCGDGLEEQKQDVGDDSCRNRSSSSSSSSSRSDKKISGSTSSTLSRVRTFEDMQYFDLNVDLDEREMNDFEGKTYMLLQ
jgi:hypothetical protein